MDGPQIASCQFNLFNMLLQTMAHCLYIVFKFDQWLWVNKLSKYCLAVVIYPYWSDTHYLMCVQFILTHLDLLGVF